MPGKPERRLRQLVSRTHGFSFIELLLVLAIVVTLAAVAAPLTARSIDASRARQAAGFVAARLRLARQQAVFRTTSIGLVFDDRGGRWTFEVCGDGNGNGLRRAEIASAVDRCVEGPYDIAQLFPGARVGIDESIPGPEGDPASADAVRFGRSNIASFSPAGTGSAGTIFIRSAATQYAVRVAGATGRLRTLRFDPASRRWGPA
jgi:prepilin-type N-terminal cleavage/methylation domain-containing protein